MAGTGQAGDMQFAPHPDFNSLQSVLSLMAEWFRTSGERRRHRTELMNCSLGEVERIAADLKIGPSELVALTKRAPDAADLLQKLLVAIGLDVKDVEHSDGAVMRDLQRSCTMCDEKRQCKFDLLNGVITDKYRNYCPNVLTLDALLQARQERRRERRRLAGFR